MNLTENFDNFLKSNDTKFEADTGNATILILKTPYNDKVDVLYGTHRRNDDFFNPRMELYYYGIYDREKNKVFDPNSDISYYIYKYKFDDIRLVDRSMLYKEIIDAVNEKIKEHISNEPDMFDYSDVEIEEVTMEDIYREFLDGETSDTYIGYIKPYMTEELKDIFEYLSYGDEFVDETARDFIIDNYEDLLKNLKRNSKKQKLLKELEENKEHPYHKQKDIMNSIRGKDYKTINLTINKNGIEQTLKYETKFILYCDKHLYTYHIANVSDRKKYEENYGRSSDIEYKDITKITYGKNIIYEDKNFKVNEIEEDNDLAR